MEQPSQALGPLHSDIFEFLRAWNSALATAWTSQEADRYMGVVGLVKESLERCGTAQDLIQAYRAPDIGLKSRVLVLCDAGGIPLQPQVVLGAACALRFREVMEAAIA